MLSLLLFTASGLAWKHSGWVWNRDVLPLKWYISDYRTPSLDEDYQLQLIFDSYDNWIVDAPCAQLSHSFEGVREGHHATGRDNSDAKNTFYWDDPNDEQGSGILGVTYTLPSGQAAFARDGIIYVYAFDSDIVFSKDIFWVPSDDVNNGCSGTPVEAVATHEIGHQWGLGHSCEENEVSAGLCEDVDIREANMFWAAPGCPDFNPNNPFTSDDIEAMTSLYGPYATFDATTETYGGVPLEVCFSLSSTSALSNVNWLYGDGQGDNIDITTPEDYEICHTYEEKGQYTVNVTISGNSEDCGDWEYTDRERAMVVVCEPPEKAEGFDGMFTAEHHDGLIYQMINQADISVYGCIDQIQWDVFQGEELIQSVSAWSPKIEFPKEGKYRVVLNLGGPGGITAEELSIDVVNKPAEGCSALGMKGTSTALTVLALFGLGLRRREN
ncbi:MAG: PKD domain-containing protein [Myxococcota bacterium]|nr:PKD domain-containing protein [Myxococcota bacterium]